MSASIALFNIKFDEDEWELGRWLKYHRCGVEKIQTEQGEVLGICIPLFCENLVFDPDTGLASCSIYEDRPAICREYQCKRIKS